MDKLLTTQDLAERWGVTVQHIYNMRNKGKGPEYIRPLGKVFYKIEDVERFENGSRSK